MDYVAFYSPILHPFLATQGAGFGNGTADGTGHGGKVVRAGFETTQPAPAVMRTERPAFTKPVILSEDHPITADAKERQITRDVAIRVVLQSDGTVKVLGIVSGLPYGLNESAIRTAMGLKFLPAKKDNQPVGFETTVRVSFQLS